MTVGNVTATSPPVAAAGKTPSSSTLSSTMTAKRTPPKEVEIVGRRGGKVTVGTSTRPVVRHSTPSRHRRRGGDTFRRDTNQKRQQPTQHQPPISDGIPRRTRAPDAAGRGVGRRHHVHGRPGRRQHRLGGAYVVARHFRGPGDHDGVPRSRPVRRVQGLVHRRGGVDLPQVGQRLVGHFFAKRRAGDLSAPQPGRPLARQEPLAGPGRRPRRVQTHVAQDLHAVGQSPTQQREHGAAAGAWHRPSRACPFAFTHFPTVAGSTRTCCASPRA